MIEGAQYEVSEDFQQSALQIAEALGLDEVESASLLLQAQTGLESYDRPAPATALILFHQKRQTLLECLRMALEKACTSDEDDDSAGPFRQFSGLVNRPTESHHSSTPSLWRKCISNMGDIERWLQRIGESVLRVSVTGQVMSAEFIEIMDLQRDSLIRQHESLSAIAYWLAKSNLTTSSELSFLLLRMKQLDKYDAMLIHYIPLLACLLSRCAASDAHCSLQEAKKIHTSIMPTKDSEAWPLRNFQAMVGAIWLADYCGRYLELPSGALSSDVDLDKEADSRSDAFMELLKDGAFHFILQSCEYTRDNDWFDPARQGFTSFLVQDAPSLQSSPVPFQRFFQDILMEQFQSFVDAFITNMPDTLRNLKFEEDEQRRQMHGRLQLRPAEYDLHLERFLILISYAFEGFPEAAQAFWSDADGNLYGFLQWAAQRQSTPRVAAFCEMLRSLSEGESCAESAHKFLLEDSSSSSAKLRRHVSLGWSHIFGELEYYSSTVKERPVLHPGQSGGAGKVNNEQLVEPESAMMLESYLRLTTHLIRQSLPARRWVLTHTTFHLQDYLLLLCRSSIDSRLRACAFNTLTAMLTSKDREASDIMWTSLDAWLFGATSQGLLLPRNQGLQSHIPSAEQYVFELISSGFEESTAFVNYLHALVVPSGPNDELRDSLPFPETLGAAYRMSGIDAYVDFVMNRVFASKSLDLQDPIQLRLMRLACLDFAAACLSTFNEDLIVLSSRSSISVDSAIRTSSLATYARLHPFARVMEWFFNEGVIAALFACIHQDIDEVNAAPSDAPLVLGLIRSIELVDLIMSLQTTYFDVVRPIIKLQSPNKQNSVANAALATFEDAIQSSLDVVTFLGLYCGSGHQDLVVCSLKLLQKLSSSRKLSNPILGNRDRYADRNRLITALEKQNAAEAVAKSFIVAMQLDSRAIEQGPDSAGIIVKGHILTFLNACIMASGERSSIAHLILGFVCHSYKLEIADNSLFNSNRSLFHSILKFIAECPLDVNGSIISWLLALKDDATQLLRRLWKSSLSANIVLAEIRASDYLFLELLQNFVVGPTTLWDGRTLNDVDFFSSTSAIGYARFLQRRGALLELAATELKAAHKSGASSLQTRIKSSLLGSTALPDGTKTQNPSIFEMLDFLDFDPGSGLPLLETSFFDVQDFKACVVQTHAGKPVYDMRLAEQLMTLRKHELQNKDRLPNQLEDQQMDVDAQNILFCLESNNRLLDIAYAHTEALRTWTHLVIVMLETCDFDTASKHKFILHILQMVVPKLERSFHEDPSHAIVLAQLTKFLIQKFAHEPTSFGNDTAAERFAQLFRVCLAGIQVPSAPANLREILAQICQQYLNSLTTSANASSLRRFSLQNMTSLGDRLFEILCDDAYAGEDTQRTSALLLLDAIIVIGNRERSKYVLEALIRLNFIHVIVSSIKDIPNEIQNAGTSGML